MPSGHNVLLVQSQRWHGIRIGCGMADELVEQDANFIELTVENGRAVRVETMR